MALSTLNFDGIQIENARRKSDPILRKLVDQLDDAYYGTPNIDGKTRQLDGWKHGVSHPFYIFDKELTLERSELKFKILSGMLHNLTFLAQHLFNCAEQAKYPEDRYNYIFDVNGVFVETRVRQAKREIRNAVLNYNVNGFSPIITDQRLRNFINIIRNHPVVSSLLIQRPKLSPILDPGNETDVS